MSDQPTKRKVLFDEPVDVDDAFAAVGRGEATIGDVLAHVRALREIELHDVASSLRIREQFLAAIEANDLSHLPGPTYAIGFVRSYAHFLGLNGEEAVRLFKGARDQDAGKAALNFPEPVSESRIPRGAILLISLVLAVGAYGGWYYLSSRDMELADLVPQVPATMDDKTAPAATAAKPDAAMPAAKPEAAKPEAAKPAAPVVAAPAPAVTPEPAPQTAAAPEATPPAQAQPRPEEAPPAPVAVVEAAPTPATPAPEPAPAPVARATPAPAPVPQPQVAPQPQAAPADTQSAAARPAIEIHAKADSWVQIRGPGGRVVVMRIFRSGDTFKVPDEKGLTLMTGNAGAIEITVDGKPVPAVGPFGAVRRDVALDAERLRAGTAAAR